MSNKKHAPRGGRKNSRFESVDVALRLVVVVGLLTTLPHAAADTSTSCNQAIASCLSGFSAGQICATSSTAFRFLDWAETCCNGNLHDLHGCLEQKTAGVCNVGDLDLARELNLVEGAFTVCEFAGLVGEGTPLLGDGTASVQRCAALWEICRAKTLSSDFEQCFDHRKPDKFQPSSCCSDETAAGSYLNCLQGMAIAAPECSIHSTFEAAAVYAESKRSECIMAGFSIPASVDVPFTEPRETDAPATNGAPATGAGQDLACIEKVELCEKEHSRGSECLRSSNRYRVDSWARQCCNEDIPQLQSCAEKYPECVSDESYVQLKTLVSGGAKLCSVANLFDTENRLLTVPNDAKLINCLALWQICRARTVNAFIDTCFDYQMEENWDRLSLPICCDGEAGGYITCLSEFGNKVDECNRNVDFAGALSYTMRRRNECIDAGFLSDGNYSSIADDRGSESAAPAQLPTASDIPPPKHMDELAVSDDLRPSDSLRPEPSRPPTPVPSDETANEIPNLPLPLSSETAASVVSLAEPSPQQSEIATMAADETSQQVTPEASMTGVPENEGTVPLERPSQTPSPVGYSTVPTPEAEASSDSPTGESSSPLSTFIEPANLEEHLHGGVQLPKDHIELDATPTADTELVSYTCESKLKACSIRFSEAPACIHSTRSYQVTAWGEQCCNSEIPNYFQCFNSFIECTAESTFVAEMAFVYGAVKVCELGQLMDPSTSLIGDGEGQVSNCMAFWEICRARTTNGFIDTCFDYRFESNWDRQSVSTCCTFGAQEYVACILEFAEAAPECAREYQFKQVIDYTERRRDDCESQGYRLQNFFPSVPSIRPRPDVLPTEVVGPEELSPSPGPTIISAAQAATPVPLMGDELIVPTVTPIPSEEPTTKPFESSSAPDTALIGSATSTAPTTRPMASQSGLTGESTTPVMESTTGQPGITTIEVSATPELPSQSPSLSEDSTTEQEPSSFTTPSADQSSPSGGPEEDHPLIISSANPDDSASSDAPAEGIPSRIPENGVNDAGATESPSSGHGAELSAPLGPASPTAIVGPPTQNETPSRLPGSLDEGALSGDEPGSSCFPASATVELQSGEIVSLTALKLGDCVKSGPDSYSKVYFFSHRDLERLHGFVRLLFSTNTTLSLSSGHLVPIAPSGELVPAHKLQNSQVIFLGDGSSAVISGRQLVVDRGLINPHTESGKIVIDGILTSCYTTAVPPPLAAALLLPQRLVFSFSGQSLYGDFLERPQLRSLVVDPLVRALSSLRSPWLVAR